MIVHKLCQNRWGERKSAPPTLVSVSTHDSLSNLSCEGQQSVLRAGGSGHQASPGHLRELQGQGRGPQKGY